MPAGLDAFFARLMERPSINDRNPNPLRSLPREKKRQLQLTPSAQSVRPLLPPLTRLTHD